MRHNNISVSELVVVATERGWISKYVSLQEVALIKSDAGQTDRAGAQIHWYTRTKWDSENKDLTVFTLKTEVMQNLMHVKLSLLSLLIFVFKKENQTVN